MRVITKFEGVIRSCDTDIEITGKQLSERIENAIKKEFSVDGADVWVIIDYRCVEDDDEQI